MRKIKEFEEFDYNGYHVTTDLSSAWFDKNRIYIEGSAVKDGEKHQITVSIKPEDTVEFNSSISSSEGEVTRHDLELEGKLKGVEDVEKEMDLANL
jgi:hypothetical protein